MSYQCITSQAATQKDVRSLKLPTQNNQHTLHHISPLEIDNDTGR